MNNEKENEAATGKSTTPESNSRRDFLKGALQAGAVAAGAGLLSACGPDSAGAQTTTGTDTEAPTSTLLGGIISNILTGNYRIDVHCHHIPDFYRQSLADNGITTAGGIDLPSWTPDLAVDFMNKFAIQSQVLSISEPGVYYLPTAAQRLDMARRINDYTTNTLINSGNAKYAGRFGGFACLPLGNPEDSYDIENAKQEAIRALNTLRMDGIGLFSNYNGVYLGDPAFDPLMETLNSMGAMVFLHPVTPIAKPDIDLPTFLYEFPFDTTRAVVNMFYKNVFLRYPNIRWLLAHAGGAIPFLSYRVSLLKYYPAIAQNLGISSLDDGTLAFNKMFYDTALSPTPAVMRSVRAVTSVDHIMFATDWPFSSQIFTIPGDPAPQLKDTFSSSELNKVSRYNALDQFPRLKARIGA